MLMDQLLLRPEGKKELQELKGQGDEPEGFQMDSQAGCTANVSVVYKNHLYTANSGDSRTVLCSKGKTYAMSIDHKPDDDLEYQRITKAGGTIIIYISLMFANSRQGLSLREGSTGT